MKKWINLLLTLLSVVVLSLAEDVNTDSNDFKEFFKSYETLRITPTILDQSTKHINAHVSFNAHGRNFNLVLKTNKNLFTQSFQLRVHEGNGAVRTLPMETRHYVTGYIEGEVSDSVAHGKISEQRFEGIIHTINESYHIERIEKHFTASDDDYNADHNVVVYKSSDLDSYKTRLMSCGVAGNTSRIHRLQEFGGYFEHRKNSGNLRRKRLAADDDFNTCHIHVWADYEFFSNIGNSDEAETLDEMAIHMLEADNVFRSSDFTSGLTGYGVAITSADIIKTNNAKDNPLYGTFTVEELLEAFASFEFDDVCLGHLFTYRDFQGTLGLAYVADPSGSLAGGICDKRTQTFNGQLNLNTGLTSLITFGRKLPRAVSTITTTHEIGHNFGSEHDPSSSGTCSPGGSQGNYIMYPTATDGNLANNRLFSQCSKDQIGPTIRNKGNCFIPKPSQQECGNGIVEGDEECDCKYNDTVLCDSIDPCCKPGECKLKDFAECSPNKYQCCNQNCTINPEGTMCSQGDECLSESVCNGRNASCPSPERKNGTLCNEGNNVCDNGVCSGSICALYDAEPCFCTEENELCDVCCVFGEECQSTFTRPGLPNATIQSGFPCKDFTGYCDAEGTCIFVDTNRVLNDLKNIIPSFTSIVNWLKNNWYWVLVGVALTIILIVLLQVTYRRKNRKKKKTQERRNESFNEERQALTRDREDATRL